MSEQKWTKAEWLAVFKDQWGWCVTALTAAKTRYVCFKLASEADAHLIAAAPDMYEALKSAEQAEAALIMEWHDFWDVAPPSLLDKLKASQDIRNAAIAKAEGR